MDTILKLSGFGDTVLSYLLPFLFVLTIVVFFHELGHFLVARWCGVAVKTFSIGFGPEIVGFNDRHGTRWRLSWIPLGGYVKFIDDENAASAGQRPLEGMTEEERKHSFQGKSLGARAAIVAASPIATSCSGQSRRASAATSSGPMPAGSPAVTAMRGMRGTVGAVAKAAPRPQPVVVESAAGSACSVRRFSM